MLTFVTAVLAAGGIFYGLVVLLDFQEIDTTTKLDAKTLFDLVKLSFGVVAGAGALVALVVAYRRQRVDEAGAHREATRLHAERFSQAVDKLGSDSPAVRLGGVHALAGLADDAPTQDLRQTCVDVLCAYLRLPFPTDPGDLSQRPDSGTSPTEEQREAHQNKQDRYRALREVRHTISRLIGDHYRYPTGTHRSWQGCDLDLSGVTIDGPMDFSGAVFSGGTVGFRGATFAGGTVSFGRATFSGGAMDFSGAAFSGGTVNFRRARFSDGTVNFAGAGFSGSTVDFVGATFSDGTVDFDSARFSDGTVDFRSTAFPGGTVNFGRANFSGGTVDFDSATFSGSLVSFLRATFSDGTVNFFFAKFSNGTVSFRGSTFSDGTVSFLSARFCGGAVDFNMATGRAPDGLPISAGSSPHEAVSLPASWLTSSP